MLSFQCISKLPASLINVWLPARPFELQTQQSELLKSTSLGGHADTFFIKVCLNTTSRWFILEQYVNIGTKTYVHKVKLFTMPLYKTALNKMPHTKRRRSNFHAFWYSELQLLNKHVNWFQHLLCGDICVEISARESMQEILDAFNMDFQVCLGSYGRKKMFFDPHTVPPLNFCINGIEARPNLRRPCLLKTRKSEEII